MEKKRSAKLDSIEILAEPNIKKLYCENVVIIKFVIPTKFEKKELFEFILSDNPEESLEELCDRNLEGIINSEFDLWEIEDWEFDDILEKAYDSSYIYDVLKIIWIDLNQLYLFDDNRDDIKIQSVYEKLSKKYDAI